MLAAMVRILRVIGTVVMAVVVTACGSDDGDSDAQATEPSTVTATASATETPTEVVTTEKSGLSLTEACRRVGKALPKDMFFPPGYGDDWVDFSTEITQIYTESSDEALEAIQPFYDTMLELSHSGAGVAQPGIDKIIKLSDKFTKALGKLERSCIF